jgi:hypothetical protein
VLLVLLSQSGKASEAVEHGHEVRLVVHRCDFALDSPFCAFFLARYFIAGIHKHFRRESM